MGCDRAQVDPQPHADLLGAHEVERPGQPLRLEQAARVDPVLGLREARRHREPFGDGAPHQVPACSPLW